MKTFDILNSNTLPSSLFLQASAGTGKTFTLEHLFIRRLIETSPEKVSLPQILVVTFTHASTQELKGRIKQKIQEILNELKEKKSNIPYVQKILENPTECSQAIIALQKALLAFHKASIFTLHSFCYQALQKTPCSYNHLSLDESLSSSKTWEERVNQHLTFTLSFSEYPPWQMQSLLKAFRGDLQALKESLKQDLSSCLPIEKLPSTKECLKQMQELFERLAQSGFNYSSEFSQFFKGNFSQKKQCLRASVSECAENFSQLLKNPKSLNSPLFLQYFLQTHHPDKLLKKYQALSLESYRHFYQKLQELLPLLTAPSMIYTRLLKTLHQQFYQNASKDTLSPDQLLLTTKKALENASFLSSMQQEYKVICIDEFQDTDPLQWHIFSHLFPPPHFDYYLVGDPKQSIYGFRQADLYTYLEAKKSFQSLAQLSTNFRASPKLCEALNLLFDNHFTHHLFKLPMQQSFLPFCPSESYSIENEDIPYTPPLKLAFFKVTQSLKSPLKMEEGFVLPWLFQKVQQLLKQGVCESEIAILVKDRYQAKRVITYLHRLGLNCSQKEGLKLSQSSLYFAFRELLQAFLDPQHLGKIKIALMNECLQYSPETLLELEKSPYFPQLIALFQKGQLLWMEKGLAAFISELRKIRWPPDNSTLEERLLSHPQKKQWEVEFSLIISSLLDFSTRYPTPTKFLLNGLDQWHKFLKEEEKQRKEKNPCQQGVQLLTLHASKGLEFDHVFPIGGLLAQNTRPLTYFLNHPKFRMRKAALPEDPQLSVFHEEQNAEKMRLFYVACTRAKKQLFLPFFLPQTLQASLSNLSLAEVYLLSLLAPQCLNTPSINHTLDEKKLLDKWKNQFPSQLLQIEVIEKEIQVKPTKKQLLTPLTEQAHPFTAFPSSLPFYSYTSLKKGERKGKSQQSSKSKMDLQPLLPRGVETGILLHQILQDLPFTHLATLTPEEITQRYVKKNLRSSLLEGKEEAITSLLMALNNLSFPALKGGNFFLPQIPETACIKEGEFLHFIPKKPTYFMQGIYDLLFEHEGIYYLLDWKSDDLGAFAEDYNLPELKAHSYQHYLSQIVGYSEALQEGLSLKQTNSFGGFYYVYLRGLSFGKGLLYLNPEELKRLPPLTSLIPSETT